MKARDLSLSVLLTPGCALRGGCVQLPLHHGEGAPLPGVVSGQTGKAAQGGRRRGLHGDVRSYLESVSNRETIVAKIRERADAVDYSGTT